MKSAKGFMASMWIGIIVGVGLLIWSVIAVTNYNNLKDSGITVQASVEQIDKVTYKKGHPSTYGTAVYYDENGGRHSFNGYLGDFVDIGDKVSLIYENGNPDNVVRENPAISWMFWISGGLIVFCGGLLILLVLFRKDKKRISCMQQAVPPDELARIVREYMPQTKQKFIAERSKHKLLNKPGCDTVLQQMIDSGDPIRQIYDNYNEIISSNDIRLAAVVRVTDRDIYSPMQDIMSESVESGRSRLTVPAFMIYGEDDYFNEHPNELIAAAERLSGKQYGTVLSQEDSECMGFLSDNRSRPFAVRYCSELTRNRTVILNTVILSKPALCNQKLCNNLLYLAVSGQYAAVIPAYYYTLWELSAF